MNRRFSTIVFKLSLAGLLLGGLSFNHSHAAVLHVSHFAEAPASHVVVANALHAVVAPAQMHSVTALHHSPVNTVNSLFSHHHPFLNGEHAISHALKVDHMTNHVTDSINNDPTLPKNQGKWSKHRQVRHERSIDWDWRAQQDMRARMSRDGQAWSPVEGTFKKDVHWSPDWELRWWSFKTNNNRTVWVYHVRSKSSGERYTSLIDPHTGQWQNWQSAW
jgi:hypothetical protein